MLSSGFEHGAAAGPQVRRGNCDAVKTFRIEIVQKADTSCLFDELDAALQSGSSQKRLAMLRQVTDLFLIEADRLSEEQIGIFDVVVVQLIERIEARTLTEISEGLAPVANAPTEFAKLSKANAERLLRFWQIREASARSA